VDDRSVSVSILDGQVRWRRGGPTDRLSINTCRPAMGDERIDAASPRLGSYPDFRLLSPTVDSSLPVADYDGRHANMAPPHVNT